MANINNVTLVGRLTKDAELRYTPNGTAVANFSLAVQRTFKNANGDYEADFINCLTWRKTAENLAQYTKKGNLVGVTGRIQTRSYENQEGKRVYVTEVVAESVTFLEPSKNNGQNNGNSYQNNQQMNQGNSQMNPTMNQPMGQANPQPMGTNNFAPIDITDDDLPF